MRLPGFVLRLLLGIGVTVLSLMGCGCVRVSSSPEEEWVPKEFAGEHRMTLFETFSRNYNWKPLVPIQPNRSIVNMFGVKTINQYDSILKNLSKVGVISIDSMSIKDFRFDYHVMEFAGVKFGINNGFFFMTSCNDREAIKSLVGVISKYYGEPDVEGDREKFPEYYHWNYLNQKWDEPWIRIRPLHTENGGLVMVWEI